MRQLVYYPLDDLNLEYPGKDSEAREQVLKDFLISDLADYAIASALGINPQTGDWDCVSSLTPDEWAHATRRAWIDMNDAPAAAREVPQYEGIFLTADGRQIGVDAEQLHLWAAHCRDDVADYLP